MEKNGYLESCHQLNPNNGIKQLENQHNPCLLDVYIYSLICLNLEMRTCDYIVSVLISFSLSFLFLVSVLAHYKREGESILADTKGGKVYN
jgi:hypothetical protein